MRKHMETIIWVSLLVLLLVIVASNSKTGGNNYAVSLSFRSFTGTPTAYSYLPVIPRLEPLKTLTPTATSTPTPTATSTPTDIIWEMIDQVNQDRALTDLRRFTGEEPICTVNGCYTITNRETGSEGLQWAKDYVYESLSSLDYSIEVQDWSRGGYADQNLIARKQGSIHPDEEIYLIAHLDGYRLDNPAADDDASGAVSLLELARILCSRDLSRTVVLFFSTGEEHGALGSRSFVEEYPERLDTIKYLVSVEMLGYDSNNDWKMELWSGNQPLDFVNMLTQIITTYQLDLIPEVVTGCT